MYQLVFSDLSIQPGFVELLLPLFELLHPVQPRMPFRSSAILRSFSVSACTIRFTGIPVIMLTTSAISSSSIGIAFMLAFFFPICFCFFQFFLQAFFSITQVKQLLQNSGFLLLYFFRALISSIFFSRSIIFLRNIDIFQMHSCTHFIQHINCFIGQQTISHITVTQFHTGINRFIIYKLHCDNLRICF